MSKFILIVDDSETCAETLQIALETMPGMEAKVTRNSAEALAALRKRPEDIAAVVTDLHMRHDDGFELIKQLRAEPRFTRLPVLLISGDSDPLLPSRALAQGADAFFSKPYSPAAVRRKLEQLLC